MANITKLKRDKMLQFLHDLKKVHTDDASIRAFNEIENALLEKKFGLVFEEHTEAVDEKLKEYIPVLCADKTRKICKDPNLPYNFIIEGDNLQALYLLEKTHKGKVDCIYIDPPYNTGAKDWKYNNDYVDERDAYRHSKWLSMMKTRLLLAKRLLNPDNSVLICTIDEKEYLHLGCLLEELFPEARMQMISSVIHPGGVAMDKMFYRSDEYLFYVFLGNSSPQKIPLGEEWLGGVKNTCKGSLHWASLRRMDGTTKFDSPGCFYPIFVRKDGKKIIDIGDPVPLDMDRNSVLCPKDAVAIFPIRTDNIEGRWGISPQKCREKWEKGFLKLGNFTKFGMSIMYLREGEEKKVLSGEFEVVGYREDGSIIVDEEKHQAAFIPTTQWRISTHDADKQGTRIINCLLAGKRFNYPKSLYAVKDSLNFIVANNPEALIVDFFAGSGTTLHAVNLLNAEDGGRRKCIMVTNNEISAEEEKRLRDKGLKKGDAEWDALGIARHVTWPRTECSINGVDVNGNALKGNYIGSGRSMADGFKANVKYFKCDWTPRKPQDYLLSNALCLHITEMIELQNAIEVDNVKNVILFNKEDYKKYIEDKTAFSKIENLWVNQNIIFDAKEIKKLQKKHFKYIPKEFFGQELMEAAE